MTLALIMSHVRHAWRPLVVNGVILLLAAALFTGLAEEVWEREALAWDSYLATGLHALGTPLFNVIMKTVTWTGAQLAALFALLVVALFMMWRAWRMAIFTGIATVGAALIALVFKALFQRPRPTLFPPLTTETSYSFPSGHTLTAVGLYGFIAVLLWQADRRGWALLAAGWPILVGVSRIYLGVHYPSDVLASFALGVGWLIIVAHQYSRGLTAPTLDTHEQSDDMRAEDM